MMWGYRGYLLGHCVIRMSLHAMRHELCPALQAVPRSSLKDADKRSCMLYGTQGKHYIPVCEPNNNSM